MAGAFKIALLGAVLLVGKFYIIGITPGINSQ